MIGANHLRRHTCKLRGGMRDVHRIPEVHAGVDHPTHSHTIHERASANVKGDRNVHKATRGIKGMRVQVATMPVSACASAECGGPLGSPAAHGAVVGWREPPT